MLAWAPFRVAKHGGAAGPAAVETTEERRTMWRELGSKVRVYWLVRVAAVRLRLDPRTPWSELVAQVHRHAPYPALFRLEREMGDGHCAWGGLKGARGLVTANRGNR